MGKELKIMKKLSLVKILFMIVITIGVMAYVAEASYTVTSNPLWTDIFPVSGSDTFVITAVPIDGNPGWTWQVGQPGTPFDAAGQFKGPSFEFDEWVKDGNHGELIGFVGTVNPNSVAALPDPRFFAIGNGPFTLSGRTGELWLGFNDDFSTHAISDNAGYMLVNIEPSTKPVPEPSALLLIGAGLVGVGFMRKRFKK
jgi:hypothetical protein